MTKIFHDQDADPQVLSGRVVTIVGYGNQGRAQALNLRDSGAEKILIGTTGDPAEHRARDDGFPVCTALEATRAADIVFVLIPDEVMPTVYRDHIAPGLEAGNTLVFASGYNITFDLIQPPADVDVIMLAPRMVGEGVRELFRNGRGYPAFVAVHRDATGNALRTVLALAKAIGATRRGVVEVTFRDETMIDLLAEQAVWPIITAVLTETFRFLKEKGHPAEASLMDLYLSKEPAYMFEKMAEIGLFKQLPLHSHTSQYGQLSRHRDLDKTFIRKTLESAYQWIDNGGFADEWKHEQSAGLPVFRRLFDEAMHSEITRTEETLLESGSGGVACDIDAEVVTESLVLQALQAQPARIRVRGGAVITPSAADAAREAGVSIVRGPDGNET